MTPTPTPVETRDATTEDTEALMDREYNAGKNVGAEQERERISHIIWEMSCAAFMDNKDEEARKLRNLHTKIQKP